MRQKHWFTFLLPAVLLAWLLSGCLPDEKVMLSGIYPHLAYYNHEGECGTGAVVPWADRLWVVTYGPHLPHGSSDKLYEITRDLEKITRPESIGGTPANRMIHRESNQLFIGPYAISGEGKVQVIPYDRMPGRHTGNARHLADPEGKIYYATMEEGFYEVDVASLRVTTLVPDAHQLPEDPYGKFLPGAHGKGLYSGQGVLVYSNNGEASREARTRFDAESGALVEWNGSDWKLIRRNQFVEVTGPGGIYGNSHPATDPIWATGWDQKSLLLGVRDAKTNDWRFYRLPKASHSYDGAHGWNTEWPRIRDVGTPGSPDYLMTMHGMFWRFPENWNPSGSGGIRPRSAYLKVIGDFARWGDRLVMGCDDSAQREFLNKRKVKGSIEGPGQSNSNLWFMDPEMPGLLGPATAEGGVWLKERVTAGVPSEPFLFTGWTHRTCWIQQHGEHPVELILETDLIGDDTWTELQRVVVAGGESLQLPFSETDRGEWIRAIPQDSARVTLHFCYTDPDLRDTIPEDLFRGISFSSDHASIGGLLYGLGDDQEKLGLAVSRFEGDQSAPGGYYELDESLQLVRTEEPGKEEFIREKFAIPEGLVSVESSSVLVIDDSGRRWRLPPGETPLDLLTESGTLRISREVATERDLFSCHGTFYELPAENADGFAKIRPVASHPFRIHDYASYRGLLVMTGIDPEYAGTNPHVITSEDRKAAVWAGVIDDLWKLGKPTGRGGPWHRTLAEAGEPSDPYLIGFYDRKHLMITHDSPGAVTIAVEIDPTGHGPWMKYREVTLDPGETFNYLFPAHFQARWIRFRSHQSARITTLLTYE